jgi:uncharacterized protein (TIRG00374 family)
VSKGSHWLLGRIDRRLLSLLVRLIVTTVALAWLVFTFRWSKIVRNLTNIHWPVVGVALAIFALWILPCSWRWHQIATACGYPVAGQESAWAYFVGCFFNAFLPTGRGGDVVRALAVAQRQHCSAGGLMATVFVERVVGAFVTLCLVVGAALLAVSQIEALRPALVSASLLGAAILAAAAIAASGHVRKAVSTFVGRVANRRLSAIAADVLHVLGVVRRDPVLIASLAGLSLLNQSVLLLSGFVLAKAIPGFDVPWFSFLIVIPLVFIAGILPSIGGYGVREVGYVVAWSWFGVDSEMAGAYALLQLLFLWIMSLIGALLFATSGLERRLPRAQMPGATAEDVVTSEVGQP